jgi:pyruvate formate lyase activating enzyme
MISDFMKVSLNDYPGKIASTVFTAGCNFKCPYCHNSSLIQFSNKNVDQEFFDYIDNRKHLIKAVCITGGEPTLQNGLEDFCKKCKERKLSVKLDTNGSNPKVLKSLIENDLLDYIALDIKAPYYDYLTYYSEVDVIENVKLSLELIKKSDKDYEIRTTVHPKLLTKEKALDLAEALVLENRIVLQGYKYSDGVLDPNFCGKDPCTTEYINEIRNIMIKYIENVDVRV